jgi:poly(hydroxyalkanoate) depolymerase family esterase
MSDSLPDDMMKASRLTQAGRLVEATALLQRLLRGGAFSRTSAARRSATDSIIDLPAIDAAATTNASDVGWMPTKGSSNPDSALKIAAPALHILQDLHLGRSADTLPGLRKPSALQSEVVPTVGRFVAQSFANEAGRRAYKLYIPSLHNNEPRPLIVMLHGCTQTPDDFAAGTRMNFVAEEQSCFVVYPEQAVGANSSKCWNWFKSSDQKRGQGEPAIIAGITRHVMEDYKIDPRRVYIAGLSAGGAAAANVAEAYPDLFAAVGVHSGLACGVARDLPSAFAAMQGHHPVPDPKGGRQAGVFNPLPTIVFHGDRDSTVHPRNGGEVIARARAGGDFKTVVEKGSLQAGRAYTRSIQRDASGRRLVEEWVIHGAGHAWSGGSTSGSFTDPKGPDATKEMLRFFLEHKLDLPTGR